MKKTVILLMALLMLILTGCTENREMNLSVFIESFNKISEEEIDYTDFTGKVCENGNTEYSFFISEKNKQIYIKLIYDNSDITESRVMLSKVNGNSDISETTEDYRELFEKAAFTVAKAYTRDYSDDIEILISNILKNNEADETTDKYENYNIIYLNNDLCSELIIRNKWFFEEETTVKPENRNSFLNSAPIRTETVPHR